IFLGVEESMKHPDTPCGLKTDAERARRVRQRVREMLNSRGVWQPYPKPTEVPLREIFVAQGDAGLRPAVSGVPPETSASALKDLDQEPDTGEANDRDTELKQPDSGTPHATGFRSVLSEPAALEKVGTGTLCVLSEEAGEKIYGRAFTVAD